jgi:hypothetical protein
VHSQIAQVANSQFWRLGVEPTSTHLKVCEKLRTLAEFTRCRHPRAEVTSKIIPCKNLKSEMLRILTKGLELGRIFLDTILKPEKVLEL